MSQCSDDNERTPEMYAIPVIKVYSMYTVCMHGTNVITCYICAVHVLRHDCITSCVNESFFAVV